MINHFKILNFKSHKETSIALKNLTILSGQNGVGKSSFLQGLLLLRQSFLKSRLNDILDLNDPLCYIGKTKDALYQFYNKDDGEEISFVLSENDCEYSWLYDASQESTYLRRINDVSDSDGFENLSLFQNRFQYISASRISEYLIDDYAVDIQKQLSLKEGKGELTAQFLFKYQKSLKVIDSIKHFSEEDPFLLSQTTAWEREISKGVNIIPIRIGDGYEIRYGFEVAGTGPPDDYSQKNVGFGLSYSLPVIVSILSSEQNSLLLIENPESHIHPYGQAKLAELICRAAQSGIQLIIETHSDHIINGILVQCKKFEKNDGKEGVDLNNVSIYHFNRDDLSQQTLAKEVIIEKGGRLKNRPKGFFDQFSMDIKSLI